MAYNEHTVSSILKQANLSQYRENFEAQGADDAKQLALMSQQLFLQLVQHVGMSSKPFHVTRLLSALQEAFGIAPEYDMPAVPEKSKLVYQGQPEFVSSVNKDVFEDIPKRRKTKPFYGEVKLPAPEVFAELTDVRTDEETNELITQLAAIYRVEKPNKYQQYINACAAELAVRDPTLLARRADLITKAREANMRGGQYKFRKGFSISKYAPDEVHAQNNSKSNFALANKHREKRLAEIQKLESTIQSCMFEKEGLFERLKTETDKDNTAAIGFVRSRLDSLEEQLYVSKKRLLKLKNSQKRSEKYYTVKLSKLMSGEERSVTTENKPTTDNSNSSNDLQVPKGPIKIVNSKKPHFQQSRSDDNYASLTLDDLNVDVLNSVTVSRDYAPVTTYGLAAPTMVSSSHILTSQSLGSRSSTFAVTNQSPMAQSRDYEMSNQTALEQDILTDVFTSAINSNQDVEEPGFEIPNYHSVMHDS